MNVDKEQRETAIQFLEEAEKALRMALWNIKAQNQSGKQFDFVTSPHLSNAFDEVVRVEKEIYKIVYQK